MSAKVILAIAAALSIAVGFALPVLKPAEATAQSQVSTLELDH